MQQEHLALVYYGDALYDTKDYRKAEVSLSKYTALDIFDIFELATTENLQ